MSSTGQNTSETMTFMNSILDHHSPTTDHIFKMAINLSTDPASSAIEPLPHLDYYLINQLISLARPHLTKHDLKRMEYLADARRSFYVGHAKFQEAYRNLQDADACGDILDNKFEELKRELADALAKESSDAADVARIRKQLHATELQRRTNNESMRTRLETLQTRAKARQDTTAWFSNLKVVFLKDELPGLVALGKKSYEWAMQHPETGSAATSSQEDGVEMEDCFDTSKGESEAQDPAFGVAVDEGKEGEEKTTL
ncbi:hypothetical protein BDR22DRAFT_174462 [Usnea florida]